MKKNIKKVLKTGYGLGLLTIEEAQKIAANVKKELDLDETESRRLAKELVKCSGKISAEVLNVAGKYFEKAVNRWDDGFLF